MLTAEEIAEERCVTHLGIRVRSAKGYLDVTHVCKTTPLPVWELKTTKRTLVCAGKHLVVLGDDTGECCPVERLAPGSTVVSEDGLEVVESVTDMCELRVMYDLRVEGPDHVYFTNGLLSHNSTGIGAALLYKLNMLDHYRALYIAPLKDQVKTFADRLQDMQRGSIFSPEATLAKGLRNNLYYKESARGGSVRLSNLLTDPSRIRGITADEILLDECLSASTHISLVESSKIIVDLAPGDVTVAFDEQNNITTDRVVRVVPKGLRHTWLVTTTDGETITCTGNERLRSSRGWIYLAEILTEEENRRCPRSQRAAAVGAGAANGHRNNVGGRESVDAVQTPTLPSGSRPPTEGLLRDKGEPSIGVHSHADESLPERRLRGVHRAVRHAHVSGVRLPDPALLPGGKWQAQENRHPGVGVPDDLGVGSLVVHGRRLQAGADIDDLHSLVLEGGSGSAGGLVDPQRVPGVLSQDPQGADQDLLHPQDTHRIGGVLQDAGGPFHPTDDALQAGGRRPSWDGVELYVLRQVVRGQREALGRPGESSVLQESELQARREGSGNVSILGETGQCYDLPESQAATVGGRAGSSPGGEGPRTAAPAGAGVGPDLQGGETRVEAGVAGEEEIAGPASYVMLPVRIASITYAGEQEVWDVETEKHHTLFAGGIAVHNCQDFDMNHLPELAQVQKASKRPSQIFAGTSKDLDTCLETQYQLGSRGVWHVRGGKPGLWWSLNDPEVVDKIITVDGLRCPETRRMLNPMEGEFVHEDIRRLHEGFPSFHLPQLIVPEYASGTKWLEIWNDFIRYPRPKFLQEVMGIPVASGNREITEDDLKKMCDPDMTFEKIQAEILGGQRHYNRIISGCDWGGSDYNPATATKQSYTVHVMLGITHDGNFDLIHAQRYAGMAYQDIAGHIVHKHNEFGGFAIAADNGVGHYYNAYLRDCGKIRSDRLILFQYNDVKDFIAPIQNSMFNLFSLNRTDSISALFGDVKAPKLRLRCPRWDQSATYLNDFTNSIRSVTETPGGKNIMRYIRHGSKADDFMQAVNFAVTLGRVILREPLIPSQQLIDEIAHTMQMDIGGGGTTGLFAGGWGDYFSG